MTESRAAHTWRPDRFMVIVPHPDDADFGPAATAAAWIASGSRGWLVCCTSGDAGAEDARTDPARLAREREEEQRAAIAVIGYEGVTFLHRPDGALANDLALREELTREIRRYRPDAVICGDPEVVIHQGGGVNHTDHRAAALAAVDAVYPAARNPMAFPWLVTKAGLEPWKVRRIYLFWSNGPDAWIDVTATMDRKIEALRCHASQLHDAERVFERVRARLSQQGEQIGVDAAEAFRVVVIEPDVVEGPEAADEGQSH